jgi:hypothetical protein
MMVRRKRNFIGSRCCSRENGGFRSLDETFGTGQSVSRIKFCGLWQFMGSEAIGCTGSIHSQ